MNIFEAVENGDIARVRELIANGANVNESQDFTNETPLLIAVKSKHENSLAIVQELLANGAEVNVSNFLGTPLLHNASQFSNNPEIIRELIRWGASVNGEDNFKQTALHIAAKYNKSPEIAAVLLEEGSAPNAKDKDGKTPLHNAAEMNPNSDMVAEVLLKKQAKPDAVDTSGKTSMHYAVKLLRKHKLIELLIAHKANIGAEDNNGKTPLHIAAEFNKHPEISEELIKVYRANPKAKDYKGNTPLHDAVSNPNKKQIAKALAYNGADIFEKNEEGKSPLDLNDDVKEALKDHSEHLIARSTLLGLLPEFPINIVEGTTKNPLGIVAMDHYGVSESKLGNGKNVGSSQIDDRERNNELPSEFEGMLRPSNLEKINSKPKPIPKQKKEKIN